MAGNPHPVYRDGVNVAKSAARSYTLLRLATADELRAMDGSTFWYAYIQELGGDFVRSTTDTTSPDDDETVIVDANGARWIRQLRSSTTIWVEDFGTDQAALESALNAASVSGVKEVRGGRRASLLIELNSAVTIPAGVVLDGCRQSLTLKQASGADLSDIVVLSEGSRLNECVIDGNRPNNTDANGIVAVRVGNSNDCAVTNCVLRDLPGHGVVVNAGLRAKIKDNEIYNFWDHGIAVYGTAFAGAAHEISGNYIHRIGWSAILTQHSDNTIIKDNRCYGQIVGGRNGRTTVNINSSVVTWESGVDFTSIQPGNFLVCDNGAEYRVLSKSSNISLTVDGSPADASDIPATLGSGDLIGNIASSFTEIRDNYIANTATFGTGLALGSTAVQCGNNIISTNNIRNTGKNAINLNGAIGSGYLENNSILGNKIFNPGYGDGLGSVDRIGIFLLAGTPGQISNTVIANNTILSYSGSGQATHWLGTDGQLGYGSVSVLNNLAVDLANGFIFNDIVSVTLSSGFGSTATVDNIISHGSSCRFTINCSGTGFGYPSFVVLKICDGANTPALPIAQINAVAGGAGLFDLYGNGSSAKGQWTFYVNGMPADGNEFGITIHA